MYMSVESSVEISLKTTGNIPKRLEYNASERYLYHHVYSNTAHNSQRHPSLDEWMQTM